MNETAVHKGEIVSGVVKNIQPYGAFIQTDKGIDGLLYIEDISVARIKTPKERLSVGQKINVVVKDVNTEKNRVYFSYKEMLGTWDENIKDIRENNHTRNNKRNRKRQKRNIH